MPSFKPVSDTQAEAIHCQVDALQILVRPDDLPSSRWIGRMRRAIEGRDRISVWATWFARPAGIHRHVEDLF